MVLGKGAFAVVFKGILNEEPVAVKRFNGTVQVKEFSLEIDVMGKLSHRSLVKLLGYCTHKTERILVYEYMSGGTLCEHLQPCGHTPLTWAQRMKISLDVARGMEYLHGMTQQSFVHRDLKPSNILLDQDLRAKVSDFGLVRIIGDKSSTSKTAASGDFSTKVDVYAYGVVLMEIITGRKVIDDSLPQDDRFLVPIFRKNVLKENFRNIVDPTLELNGEDWNTLLEVANLAHNCTAVSRRIRE
ncbi:Receptor-like kinase TMK4 [Dichanthelium oligosanthes]|uniref:non-specific serine/threonine protein kinase n=1 Tax=Dichanthelium oligosanthes TaxID=888268 RepID=A0A1E5WKY8_9POAL|nr:Receptor-like kinase TMK4 [Dichanthelium oligosanthes]